MIKVDNKVLLWSVVLVFLAGLYYYMFGNGKEGFQGPVRCPNLLVQKGSKFFLYNTDLAEVPGVNPVEFNDLEEYAEFLEWQRGAGIRCPVLYLQNSYDTQGNSVYKMRPDVFEPEGGLSPTPAAVSTTPYSKMVLPPNRPVMPINFDSYHSSNAGKVRPMTSDGSFPTGPPDEYEPLANAMKDQWAGDEYTQGLVDHGLYEGNEVYMY